jgi:hypothetical protein
MVKIIGMTISKSCRLPYFALILPPMSVSDNSKSFKFFQRLLDRIVTNIRLLKETNRKPLKDQLLLQGLNYVNLMGNDPHSHTSFFRFVQEKEFIPK